MKSAQDDLELDDDISSSEDDSILLAHIDQTKIDARRRLEARLEDIRLRKELEDFW